MINCNISQIKLLVKTIVPYLYTKDKIEGAFAFETGVPWPGPETRVIYQRVLTTKLLESKDLEGCQLCNTLIISETNDLKLQLYFSKKHILNENYISMANIDCKS